jgi:hypothetical protein
MIWRDVFVGGLVVAVVIILGRVIFGTPLVKQVRESFASGAAPSLTNTVTECPAGSKFYMYGGSAYCCNGNVNSAAASAAKTCVKVPNRDESPIFCTLGPDKEGVLNCLKLRAGLMQAAGEAVCPTVFPTYVTDSTTTKCCTAGNTGLTECAPNATACIVGPDTANPFNNPPTSCQFMKAQEEDGTCGTGFSPTTTSANGLNLYACTNAKTICYLPAMLARMKVLGLDTTGLVTCS